MKNHLLILQQQINSPETAEMIEELQAQVAMYEDYVHVQSASYPFVPAPGDIRYFSHTEKIP